MEEKKEIAIEENDLNDLRKKLEQKIHLTTSTDGLVTIQYTGTGEYKNISINSDLKNIDKDILEKDILDLIDYSKKQMQADLTEIISPLLDAIKPDPFTEQCMLEVSSPGLERPLKTKEALEKAVGSYVNVSLYKAIDKVKVFQGDLVAFDGETLTIDYLDKTRKKTVEIPYSTVAKARLAVKL